MKIKSLSGFVIAASVAIFLTYAHADDSSNGIVVSNAWVQAMPPSETKSVAYMIIRNNSQKEVVLVSASSDMVGEIILHHMSDVNAMMIMADAENIHIPARGKVILQPDGLHMMLVNFKKPVKKGDIVPITLHFQGGSAMMVNAQVKSQEEEDSSSKPKMKM